MPAERGRRGAMFALARQEENNAPMMAIFGGVFALMLVFLLLVNLYSNEEVRERLEQASEHGLYRIQRMDGGAGYAVIVFPDAVRIVETGDGASLGAICAPGSAFVDYARRIYDEARQQIVFFLLEGSIGAMFEARECLRDLWPERRLTIGWVVADGELLKSVSLDDIPSYIREHAEPLAPDQPAPQ
ncbi:MAG: hypothetical protein MPK31_07730 [Gammaproteobacteria bacterium]|nr:hypothetical protein [Gammaproteobacteria bacterium]MDA7990890.1 hypothetical protein [Gammaproteobacteria bacterium]MDA7995939.1 hypothetical protein [Gammaproteobacteria bacterium]MDA8007752.1 hypothetical protein [Gammaproteobacteria bacterium]MDA8012000.1 hypothetical protein [Gammaproteobacteria bacterium]